MRNVPAPQLLERHIRSDGTGYSVSTSLIEAIKWENCNLLAAEEVRELGVFDIVLCRNVLIYFADQTVRAVLDNLSCAMVRDGVLLVGVSESLLRYGSGFAGEERGGAFVYRKALSQ